MNIRNDLYTKTDHFWIKYTGKIFQVKRQIPKTEYFNETVFEGSFIDCLNYLEKIKIKEERKSHEPKTNNTVTH